MKRIVALFVLILSCSSPIENSDNQNQEYLPIMPLAVGNYWIIQTFADTLDSTVVISDTTIVNEKWFIVVIRGKRSILTNRSDGLYSYENTSWFQGARLVLKYPINTAAKFQTSFWWNDSLIQGSASAINIDTHFIIPPESYQCVHYLRDSMAVVYSSITKSFFWPLNLFYAPGIGFVASMAFDPRSAYSDTVGERLVSFHLN